MFLPEVLVVVPCYHSEKYISRCCDSIIAQTYPSWTAVFTIDDSTYDNTVKTIQNHHQCRFVIDPYIGRSTCATARNRGFELCPHVDYVAFLDSDDWIEPSRLEKQVTYLEDNKDVDWLSSLAYHYYNEDWRPLIDNKPGSSANPSGITTVMFRKKYLDFVKQRDGYLFRSAMKRYDDYDLVMRIRDASSGHILEPLTTLFENPDGLSRTQHPFWGNFDLWKCVIRNGQWDLAIPWTVALMRSVFIRG